MNKTIFTFLTAALLAISPVAVAAPNDCDSFDRDTVPYAKFANAQLEPIRGGAFNYDILMRYAREAIDDFGEDGQITDWLDNSPIHFFVVNGGGGFPAGFYRSNCIWLHTPGCVQIFIDIDSNDGKRTVLHEIGHHISYAYLPPDLDGKVYEKHADFWAGAIAYRISKDYPEWNFLKQIEQKEESNKRHGITKPENRGTGRHDFDSNRAIKFGWEQSEWGDSVFLYYGSVNSKYIPWIWEPAGIFHASSISDNDGWVYGH